MNEIYCPSKIKQIYLIFMSMQNKQHKFSEHIPRYLKKKSDLWQLPVAIENFKWDKKI